ncbi:MAG: hypothetical protein N2202_06555 [Proteobacteria bacterium]|nr:hypothetical protein [Pseudomonadota bacterium]
MIEKSYFIQSLKDITLLPDDAKRVYIGSEHCINAFPEDYAEIINQIEKKYQFSLLLPPLLDDEVDRALGIIDKTIKSVSISFEIVINDWGLLQVLSKKKYSYPLVLGRILSYQKRGNQRTYEVISPEELRYVPILNDKMINFLKTLGIKRVEIDIPSYDVNIRNNPTIGLSVYTPYCFQSYTLNCPFTFENGEWRKVCGRECLSNFLVYRGGDAISEFIQCGKIYYTESNAVPDIADRIVYLSWEKRNTQVS